MQYQPPRPSFGQRKLHPRKMDPRHPARRAPGRSPIVGPPAFLDRRLCEFSRSRTRPPVGGCRCIGHRTRPRKREGTPGRRSIRKSRRTPARRSERSTALTAREAWRHPGRPSTMTHRTCLVDGHPWSVHQYISPTRALRLPSVERLNPPAHTAARRMLPGTLTSIDGYDICWREGDSTVVSTSSVPDGPVLPEERFSLRRADPRADSRRDCVRSPMVCTG